MMGRRWALVAVAAAAVAAILLALHLHGQAPAPAQPTPAQPQQPVEVPVGVNATQPAESERPRPPVIVAVVEAGEGGRVLVNGTEAGVVSSTRPFTLALKAVPGRCVALDYWLVNGSARLHGNPLTLTIAGNTTVRVVFARPLRTVTITANYTEAGAVINGTTYSLPRELVVPACSLLVVEPRPHVRAVPLNRTAEITVESDVKVTLLYRLLPPLHYMLQAVINGTVQPVEAYASPLVPNNGTIELAEDGWIHFNGVFRAFYVYIPWDYTRVIVEARNVTDPSGVQVERVCPWGWDPFSHGDWLNNRLTRVVFNGCACYRPGNPPLSCALSKTGKRYEWVRPGAVFIGVEGEAWVRIEAYP